MNTLESIKEKLGKEHIVCPVIHTLTSEQVLENLTIIDGEGADGFFLVNNSINPKNHLEIYEEVQQTFPHLFHGINVLGNSPHETFRNIDGMRVDGVRVDNPRIKAVNGIDETIEIEEAKKETNWEGLYFGGVAFKYQKPVPFEELPYAINQAKLHMDILTTSGSATGIVSEYRGSKNISQSSLMIPYRIS